MISYSDDSTPVLISSLEGQKVRVSCASTSSYPTGTCRQRRSALVGDDLGRIVRGMHDVGQARPRCSGTNREPAVLLGLCSFAHALDCTYSYFVHFAHFKACSNRFSRDQWPIVKSDLNERCLAAFGASVRHIYTGVQSPVEQRWCGAKGTTMCGQKTRITR